MIPIKISYTHARRTLVTWTWSNEQKHLNEEEKFGIFVCSLLGLVHTSCKSYFLFVLELWDLFDFIFDWFFHYNYNGMFVQRAAFQAHLTLIWKCNSVGRFCIFLGIFFHKIKINTENKQLRYSSRSHLILSGVFSNGFTPSVLMFRLFLIELRRLFFFSNLCARKQCIMMRCSKVFLRN